MGIQRWEFDGVTKVIIHPDGNYVLLEDHEQVVADKDKTIRTGVDLHYADISKFSELVKDRDREIIRLRAELAAKSKDADGLQAMVASIQEYATSLEYTGKWANADDYDSCRHKVAREIQDLMGEGNDPATTEN